MVTVAMAHRRQSIEARCRRRLHKWVRITVQGTGGRPWWLSVTGPGPSFALALHCSTALGRDDRLPRRDPGFLMQQRLGHVGSYVTPLLTFYFSGISTRTEKLNSYPTAYRVSPAQLWHNWAVCCATWARGAAALRRCGVHAALASMAYQISRHAHLSTSLWNPTRHNTSWQSRSLLLAVILLHRSSLTSQTIPSLPPYDPPWAQCVFAGGVLTDAIGLRSRRAWGRGAYWPERTSAWRRIHTPAHACRSRNHSP